MKRLICFFLAVCMILSIAVFSFADGPSEMESQERIVTADSETRAEETQWVYRHWNGLLQARLWSITYGYWLTDWITIGTYDP